MVRNNIPARRAETHNGLGEDAMKGTVLVTGAQGFIGRYVTRELLQAGWKTVIGTGRSPFLPDTFTHKITHHFVERPARLTAELQTAADDPRYVYSQADTNDGPVMAEVIRSYKPEVIVHLASVRREDSVENLISGNVLGICTLLESCRANNNSVRRIVVGSSGGVYGVPAELPLRETSPAIPADPYSASKLGAEVFGRILCGRAGVEFVVGRIFNVVGPVQEERHVCGRLASQIAAIVREGTPLVITAGDLRSTRDYIDVRDVASALSLLTCSGSPGEIYNIASGVETSGRELLDWLAHAAGISDEIQVAPLSGSSAGISRHYANIEKLGAEGFRRRFDLPKSLGDVLNHYLMHQEPS
jgi:nucleoside-diphosphate-sugar epimerase